MDNLDLIVLRALRDWRKAGRRALLVTVVRTWGSSPRPVGSMMAMCEDGSVSGSVSGGCIEEDLIFRFSQAYSGSLQGDRMPAGPPRFLKYGILADEAHRFGLPCGGTLELLLEFDPQAQALSTLIEQLEGGKLMRRIVTLADGKASSHEARQPSELIVTDTYLANTVGPQYRMLLIGAGQLAEYLATMALFNGFSVSVCDPRNEYLGSWSVSGVTTLTDMPDDVVRSFKADRRSCIVALTHDPKLDDLALLEALETEAFYVGAIGSRSNNELRRKRLIEYCDQTEDSVAHLRGPIGIYIASKTPSEIAVSIMAEILAIKNGVALPPNMNIAQAKNKMGIPPNDANQLCAI
ncbi:XdhC family protein [Alcaligenaceae bacterium CGII-47]|nr:XdhC family protein [Alcaligenaceae bacterium CGII-47]